LGLTHDHVRVKISHRQTVRHILSKMGVSDDRMLDAFDLLDRRDKLEPGEFAAAAGKLGLDDVRVARFEQTCRLKDRSGELASLGQQLGIEESLHDLEALEEQLRAFGIADWCQYD